MTARLDYWGGGQLFADTRERYTHRLVSLLSASRYDAGRIAGWRVPEFVRQTFGYRWLQQ